MSERFTGCGTKNCGKMAIVWFDLRETVKLSSVKNAEIPSRRSLERLIAGFKAGLSNNVLLAVKFRMDNSSVRLEFSQFARH